MSKAASSGIATAELCGTAKAGLTERKQAGEQISSSAFSLLSSPLHPRAEDLKPERQGTAQKKKKKSVRK